MWSVALPLLILLLQPPYGETGSWKKVSLGSNPTSRQFYQLGDISEFLKTLNLNCPVCKMGIILFIPWECCESQWCVINISDLPPFTRLLSPSHWGHLLWLWEES